MYEKWPTGHLTSCPDCTDENQAIMQKNIRTSLMPPLPEALHAAVYFKHKAYKNNSEYRFLQVYRGDLPSPEVAWKQRPYSLARYRQFRWRRIRRPATLKEIVVGPAADHDRAGKFAVDCLRAFHSGAVRIRRSEIPYRAPHSRKTEKSLSGRPSEPARTALWQAQTGARYSRSPNAPSAIAGARFGQFPMRIVCRLTPVGCDQTVCRHRPPPVGAEVRCCAIPACRLPSAPAARANCHSHPVAAFLPGSQCCAAPGFPARLEWSCRPTH